jgi:hypothetical protein
MAAQAQVEIREARLAENPLRSDTGKAAPSENAADTTDSTVGPDDNNGSSSAVEGGSSSAASSGPDTPPVDLSGQAPALPAPANAGRERSTAPVSASPEDSRGGHGSLQAAFQANLLSDLLRA